MSYIKHLKENIKVSLRCGKLMLFHFIHGLIPCKYTSHDFWSR